MYLFRGVQLVMRPGLRRFVIIPVLINAILFAAVIYFAADWTYDFSRSLLPDWLDWLSFVLVPVFLLLSAIVVFFTFTLVANLIASPFNGTLAEAVESRLTGREPKSSTMSSIAREAGVAIRSELRKLGYILIRIVPLLLLFFIPVLGPMLWALFSAWMLAITYVDYPMGNHGYSFPRQRETLAQRRWLALGFGLAVMAAMAIPVVNFFVMPCAVAGATAMWLETIAPSLLAAESSSANSETAPGAATLAADDDTQQNKQIDDQRR
jgi:CysZ protein